MKKLKKKDGKSITDVFDEIFVIRKPVKLQTDKGRVLENDFSKTTRRLGNSILR